MERIIKEVFDTAAQIQDGRKCTQILTFLMSEVGELSDEVLIEENLTYKQPGKDGIVGESVDIIITALDMIHKVHPNITEEEILALVQAKCDKWKFTKRIYIHQ